MKCNQEKVDEMILALMYLGLHDESRVWKTFDWDSLNRLFEKDFISNPISKAKSVVLTMEGRKNLKSFLGNTSLMNSSRSFRGFAYFRCAMKETTRHHECLN
jgi:hypothetical protein